MPALNSTIRVMEVGVEDSTVQEDMGAIKSSGWRHLSSMTVQSWAWVSGGETPGGFTGKVCDWYRVTISTDHCTIRGTIAVGIPCLDEP